MESDPKGGDALKNECPCEEGVPCTPVEPDRRNFIVQAANVVIGGILVVFPFLAGLFVYADPLRKKKGAHGEGEESAGEMLKVATLESVPADGTPKLFPVIKTRVDAWTKIPNDRIGAVYLRRDGEKVVAFTNLCPHLGCAVSYRDGENDFFCPCHNSNFAVTGEILKGVSLRAMDTLEAEVRGGEIWVAYQKFKSGHAEKHPA